MLNSPVLDTAIGLVFIFLLYSLLATSINELIATLFSMRARMLKKGIIEGMLSNSKHSKWLWQDTLKGITDVVVEPIKLLIGLKAAPTGKLGDKVYQHPIIKNYGANSRYNTPAYISKGNFSTVLIEVLGDYWDSYKDAITSDIKAKNPTINVEELPTITKIFYLIDYLLSDSERLKEELRKGNINIDEETLKILQLHLKKSYLNLEAFTKQIEDWYDDSMNRISGWYKRQVQMMLFIIGLSLAVLFNVNIIKVAGKLSTDKDARDKLVEMAIKETDKLEGDYRVLRDSLKKETPESKDLLQKAQQKKEDIQKQLDGDIKDANNLLALGWGDYGLKENRDTIISKDPTSFVKLVKSLKEADTKEWNSPATTILEGKVNSGQKLSDEEDKAYKNAKKKYSDTVYREDRAYELLFKQDEYSHKILYILKHFYWGNNLLGFFLLAIGVSLGAPFWFDLLNKFMRIRGTGKKEGTDGGKDDVVAYPQPIQVTVNNNTNTEAVG